MKVAAVSNTTFKSQNVVHNELSDPYLYTLDENYKPKFSFKENKIEYLGGMLALIAAVVSLSKFVARKSTPKDVVEIVDKTIGLNKFQGAKRTVAQVKESILYPIMAVANGEKSLLKTEKFRTGLIIGDKNPERAIEFCDAFMEHARALNIHCIELESPTKSRFREVHKAIDKAVQYNKVKNECVIVNIGDLEVVSKHDSSKMCCTSKIEKRLAEMPKGVLWVAYTTKSNKLPYFYNNLPTLNLKLID